ncbi:hypothetical protein BWI96_12350 [Siphonobacter sp. SORGH_AS_0500]|nr:hypothetical protein BWI96_12350 [Siphonobacter sp. SORGH_AS_0500]
MPTGLCKAFSETYVDRIMKTKVTVLLGICIISILMGCASTKSSKFSSMSVPMGMDKKDVLAKFGSPYKSGYFKDTNQIFREDWYYKESFYIHGWVDVVNIIHFENGKVVSLEPLPEQRPYLVGGDREVGTTSAEKKP